MSDAQITCVNKLPRDNPYEGITHLGGKDWKWTQQKIIDSIESHTNTFYTRIHGEKSYITVIDGPNGKYLRSHADGEWNDNLLALPECP